MLNSIFVNLARHIYVPSTAMETWDATRVDTFSYTSMSGFHFILFNPLWQKKMVTSFITLITLKISDKDEK